MSAAIIPAPSSHMMSQRTSTPPNLSPSPPSRRPSSSLSSNIQGIGRTQSIRGISGLSRSTRNVSKRPSPAGNTLDLPSVSDDTSEDDARAETAALIEELKDRQRKAELASEEYQRQLAMLQTRLGDAIHEQGKLEERLQEDNERIEELESETRDALRQRREMECIYESERVTMVRDKAEQDIKQEELQTSVQRLKDTLAQREMRMNVDEGGGLGRSPSFLNKSSPDIENGQFAPPLSLQRSESRNTSKLVMQKDKMIEALRLELAEAQIKLVDMENVGGDRIEELEKALLETRTLNARLMEDNESFQLLLSEKTLSGDFNGADFMQVSHSKPSGLGSLAEELESAEGGNENHRRLEVEAKSLRDQNKALTLYIENIIGRLLQHKDFENILDKTSDLMSGSPQTKSANTDKDLPPPPPPKDDAAIPSMLQRARSVVQGPGRRSRPVSQMFLPPSTTAPSPTTTEDPPKPAPIPISRTPLIREASHRRSQSEMPQGGSLVNQMYRGPPLSGSPGQMSPGISPNVTTPRTSFFSPSAGTWNSTTTSRAPSGARVASDNAGSSSTSTFSDGSGEDGAASSRRNNAAPSNYTGAVMTQSKLRPLRLVQENREMESGYHAGGVRTPEEEDAAKRKAANRGSWMGWFNRGKEEDGIRNISAESYRR